MLKEEKENNEIKIDEVKPKLRNRFTGFTDKFDHLKIKYKKDPKKFIMLIISIVFLLTLTVGSSYAYLTYISKTENTTRIEAGTLALTFKNEKNAINLSNALPIKDSEGLNVDNEYEFTVENTGSLTATYKITLDNTCVVGKSYTVGGEAITANKCIPNKYIKVGLKEETGDYKVLENPYNWKIKGNPEIDGAVLTDEGMNFDGVDDYIKMGYENYNFNNKITVASRFKIDSFRSSGSALIDSYHYSNNSNLGFEFYVGSTGKIIFQSWDSSNTRKSVASPNAVELNKWYTAIATYDGSNMKLYLNGELVATAAATGVLKASDMPLTIGTNAQYAGSGTNYGFFDGTISDSLVINDVLTESEIVNNYSEGFNYKEKEKTLFYQKWDTDSKYILDAGSLGSKSVKNYKMKIWLDYDTPNEYNSHGTSNVIYSGKLGLSYEQGA